MSQHQEIQVHVIGITEEGEKGRESKYIGKIDGRNISKFDPRRFPQIQEFQRTSHKISHTYTE